MSLFLRLLVLISLIKIAYGDIGITAPLGGETYTGGSTVSVGWSNSGTNYAFTDISTISIKLCTGTNLDINCFAYLINQVDYATTFGASTANPSYNAVISANTGTNGLYYFQITTVLKNGVTAINYSNRFTMTGMTGTKVTATVGTVTAAPPGYNPNINAATVTDNPLSHSIPYGSQTGRVRYAPMQNLPSHTITATSMWRMFPTSSVSVFKTFMASPAAFTTFTLSRSYTIPLAENSVPANLPPESNGGWYSPTPKNRWEDDL